LEQLTARQVAHRLRSLLRLWSRAAAHAGRRHAVCLADATDAHRRRAAALRGLQAHHRTVRCIDDCRCIDEQRTAAPFAAAPYYRLRGRGRRGQLLGSFRLGSFCFGSFRLGSFRLGSFCFGSFRLGSFRLGSFRLLPLACGQLRRREPWGSGAARRGGV
jgi:hypothetical protein